MISCGSLVLSNYLIVLWVEILILLYLPTDALGKVSGDSAFYLKPIELEQAEMIDVYSYIAFLMRSYILISAINALLNFFRIFQFFQFSSKLSSFTEILKDSKSDIIYFMIMFIIIFLGFAVMITIYLGENLESFADLLSTTN